jgi:uncharacterized protein (DUF305 family)
VRPASIAAALVALALIAGCGGDGDGQSRAPDVGANGTDAAFVNAMIPHHEAGVEAGDLALARAQHGGLRRLGEEIVQSRSIALATLRPVRDMLLDAGVEEGDLGLGEDEGGGPDTGALGSAGDFDCAFLEVMVPRQEGAIRIARAELAAGIHAELRRMSELLISEQGFQLRRMRGYQRRWC